MQEQLQHLNNNNNNSKNLTKLDPTQYMEVVDDFDTDIHLRLVILACIEDKIGDIWRLQLTNESYAMVLVTDFLAAIIGDASAPRQYYAEFFDKIKRHTMIFADKELWITQLKAHFGFKFVIRKDMRFSFDEQVLDLEYLYQLRKTYEQKYDFSGIDFRLIQPQDKEQLSDYIFGYFEMFTDRETLSSSRLCHVAVDTDGRILSIAGTTDIPRRKHYEVQIATERDARKRGLGMMITITHLIYALEQGYWPHWDAATSISANIADKLGYGSRTPYNVYFHTTVMIQLLRMSKIPKLIITILRKFGKLQD